MENITAKPRDVNSDYYYRTHAALLTFCLEYDMKNRHVNGHLLICQEIKTQKQEIREMERYRIEARDGEMERDRSKGWGLINRP